MDEPLILDHTLGIEDFICQAIGAASVCWEHPGRAGVFDSERAKQIADEVLDHLSVVLR
jgi:hypothetical protein